MWLHVHHILPVLFQFVLCALHSCASHYILHSECVTVQLQQLREVQTGMLSTCNFGYPSISNNLIYFWMLFYFQVVVQLAYHSQGRRCFVIMRAKSRPTMSTLVPALTCFIKMLKLRLIARWGSALRCLRTSKYSRPRNQSWLSFCH